jgi:23S rRNA (uracil-5-)-methyltransferase RumA
VFLKNKIICVEAEKIVFPGYALCRGVDKIALFAEGLLPGETADVLVVKDKGTFRKGIVKNIISKSPERINPLCASFGLCGGCSFQNISYENQVKYKRKYASELLGFTGVEIPAVLPAPQIWRYRNKMEFSFFDIFSSRNCMQRYLQMPLPRIKVQNESAAEGLRNSGGVENFTDLGLHYKGSFDKYVSVPPCFIAGGGFLDVVQVVKKFANKNNLVAYDNKTHRGFLRHLVLRKTENNGQFLVNIVTNNIYREPSFWEPLIGELCGFSQSVYWTSNGMRSDAVLADKLTLIYGNESITERVKVGNKNYFFNISPFSFFQTNSKGAEILYNEVLGLLNPSKSDILLDLYCGTGAIGISMSRNVKKVVGVEQEMRAIENAKNNAFINGVYNAEFEALPAESWIKKSKSGFSAIVVDPPRCGIAKCVVKFLIESKAKKIVYVSCNPSTLARDLQLIIENSKYRIKKIAFVDMFPQTYHIETAVLLEL